MISGSLPGRFPFEFSRLRGIVLLSFMMNSGSFAEWVECSPMVRETWVQSQVASYQRLLKWYLIPPCLTLSNIRYVSRVKWSNPGKGVAPSPTPRCSSYWKGCFLVAFEYGRQLYLLPYDEVYDFIEYFVYFQTFYYASLRDHIIGFFEIHGIASLFRLVLVSLKMCCSIYRWSFFSTCSIAIPFLFFQ